MLSTYGEDAFAMLVDEGGQYQINFALPLFTDEGLGGYQVKDEIILSNPGVAEKGNLNVRIELTTPGGHSSVPPRHTVSASICCRGQPD